MMRTSTLSQPATKTRWADEEDDEFILPPRQVIGPDENGVKKVVEYKKVMINDENKTVKITTTSRVRNARLNKRVVERRVWCKFGDAVDEDVGARLTMVSTEDIRLERPTSLGNQGEESKPQIEKGGGFLLLCRTCGKKGEHWTSACPYKDLAPQPIESFNEQPNILQANSGGTNGTYVPPNLRKGVERSNGSDMRRRTEENSVRVSNLSEDAREADLHELCSTFGHVTRTYVSIDKNTGLSRGFGFVNFANREDAAKAIKVLNGYGYDNLILNVEWAPPRTK